MLQWIFGPMKEFEVSTKTKDTNAGTLLLQKARVNWYLSINADNLPQQIKDKCQSTFRNLSIEGKEIEFSKGFADLHSVSYENILNGKGYGLNDAKDALVIVSAIRNTII